MNMLLCTASLEYGGTETHVRTGIQAYRARSQGDGRLAGRRAVHSVREVNHAAAASRDGFGISSGQAALYESCQARRL